MGYPCAKFCDFCFSRFDFIVLPDRRTDKQNHRITEADDRYTHATTVGVSNEYFTVIECASSDHTDDTVPCKNLLLLLPTPTCRVGRRG